MAFPFPQVQLPPLSIVPLPPLPHNPPTHEDFARAIRYTGDIDIARKSNQLASAADVTQAHLYQAEILSRLAGPLAGAPPWFNNAMNEIRNRFDGMHASLRHIERNSILSLNRQCGTGAAVDFREMPFDNGQMPTQAPHYLPYLRNAGIMNDLTDQQVVLYFAGYYPDAAVPPTRVEQVRWIQQAIGCWSS